MTLLHVFVFSKSLFFLFLFAHGQSPVPYYQFRKFLDDDGAYELLWSFNDTAIQFEVNVRTTGYVGFGLSPGNTGKMSPADMVMGWVQDGNVYFGDYHTIGEDSREPIYDRSQDWHLRARPGLQYAKEENGYTTIAFERKFDTCDVNDTVITGDTMRVIYSYHEIDPNVTTRMFPHHGYEQRGSKNILFKEHARTPELFPPEQSWKVPLLIQNFEIPAKLSTRQCLVLDMTSLVYPDSYLIMYEPDIQAGNEQFLYHMILYRCDVKDPTIINTRFSCDDGGPYELKGCTNVIASWSMGSEAFYFPEGTGIHQGSDDPFVYVLHVHYTNGRNVSGVVDNSGLHLMFTNTTQTNKAGFLSLGAVSTNFRHVIPPGEARFKTSTYCSQRCMGWGFGNSKDSNLQAIGVIFHGNDIAREMKLRHFRNKKELPWISYDKNFDSFYQTVRVFNPPVTIKKATDMVSLECTYNSTDRISYTKGGWSQVDELCRASLIYYPALPIDQCLSWSSMDKLTTPKGRLVPENETMVYLESVDPLDIKTKNNFKTALQLSSYKGLCSSLKQTPNYAFDRFSQPSFKDILEYSEPPTSTCPQI